MWGRMRSCATGALVLVCLATWIVVLATERPPCEAGISGVKIIGGKSPTWEGAIVELEAVSFGGVPFDDDVNWSATKGSFVGGVTGVTVRWKAPKDSGGKAVITAKTCETSAKIELTYVFVDFPESRRLLGRGEAHSFSVRVEPSDAPVTLKHERAPDDELLSLAVDGLFLTVDNIIDRTGIQAFADEAAVAVKAFLAEVPKIDLYIFEFDLEKEFEDAVEDYLDLGIIPWSFASEEIVDAFGDAVEVGAIGAGFPPVHGPEINRRARRAFRQEVVALLDPFGDVEVEGGRIPESWKYDWKVDLNVESAFGNVVLDDGSLSLGEWFDSLGAGSLQFNHACGVIHDVSSRLRLSVTGGTWRLSAGITGSAGNSSGTWDYEVAGEIRLIMELD